MSHDEADGMNLVAAYGRTYATKEEALADWYAGKDFKIANGPYTSIRDIGLIVAQGYPCVNLWYKQNGRPTCEMVML